MLTDAEVKDAISYNERQGYCESEIMLTQRTVGAMEDGVWGPETVQKVAAWQKPRDLDPDGKVGPQTWSRIKDSWELMPIEPPPGRVVEIGCGLAAYDNRFPGHKPEEAMQRDFDTALALGCTELRYWSSEWLIDEDLPGGGAKGNRYSGPWLELQTVPEGVTLGAWVDDAVRNAKSQKFVDHLVRMGIKRAALMINRSNTRPNDTPWHLRFKRQALEAIAKLYHDHGIECVGTCWPRPSRAQIDAMCRDMAWILQVLGTRVFEVDTEGNWTKKFLQGFKTMEEAAQYLARRMRELVGDEGELELTTYTYHTENSKNASLAPLMDRLLPQAYSVRHRGNSTVGWNDFLGPGRHQQLAVERARQAAAA